MLSNLCILLGGITVFMIGLKLIGNNACKAFGANVVNSLGKITKNPLSAILIGGGVTAICQSSIAVNVVAIGMVDSGALSFITACSIIIGTNIGTTFTAQLVSLSGSEFDITGIGFIIMFIGFLLCGREKERLKDIGLVSIGLGFIFCGLYIISGTIDGFKHYIWFRNIFLAKSKFLLVLNGFMLSAIIQSSSVLTGIMVLLGGRGLLPFENSMLLILGANVGACLPVIISSFNLSENARKVSYFNLIFNLLGTVMLFVPITLYGSKISYIFGLFSKTTERKIANFHTLFNVLMAIVVLPLLKPICNVLEGKIGGNTKSNYNKLKKVERSLV